jgi:cellular nucleic acid-binding protein
MGHIARNCTKSGFGNSYGGSGGGGYGGASGGGAGKTCYSCGGYGHMSRMNTFIFPTLNALTSV